jgi:acyl carrier protein
MIRMDKKLKSIMADLFVCEISDIHSNTKRDDLSNWDSLQHLILVSEIEESFSVTFTPEEINSIQSYSNIMDLIQSKS